MTDVFISYARRDSDVFAERLTRALEAAELDVWVDLDDIPAASEWERDLTEGVLASEYVCFVISPASVTSPHCRDELDKAVARNKRVLPIMHRQVDDAEVPEPLRKLNWIPQRGEFEQDFDKSVQTLVAAVRTDLVQLRAHTRWQQRAEEWEGRGRDASLLARGTEMREAEDWLASQAGREPQPTGLQVEFINASRRASARRQRTVIAVSLVALAIAVVLGIMTLIERNHARDQRDLARSNELASSAMASLDSDPELSLILAVRAAETAPTHRSEQALAAAISASRLRAQVRSDPKPYMARDSPDGKFLVFANEDGADLYSPDGELLNHLAGDQPVYDTVFSPDSRYVLTAGADATIRRYELPTGDLVDSIDTPTSISSIAVSQRSALIAATTTEGQVLLFGFDGDDYRTLDAGRRDPVITVDFAARGAALVGACFDGATRVWNAATGEEIGVLRKNSRRYRDADVTSDGHTAVTVDQRGEVYKWNVATETPSGPPLTDVVNQGRAKSVDLSPDGSTAAIAMADGRARIVDLGSAETLAAFGGHRGALRQAEFGNRGQTLVTTGLADHTARVFDIGSLERTIPLHTGPAAIAVPTDGSLVAVAELDGELELFDPRTGEAHGAFQMSDTALREIALSPDGSRLALGGDDGDVRIWDIGAARLVGESLPHGDSVLGIAFDQTGSRLLTGGEDGHARIWDLDNGAGESVLEATYTYDTEWSAGGSVAVAVQDYRKHYVEIVDSESGESLQRLDERSASVLDFDSDGGSLVTGGFDGAAHVWSTETGDVVAKLANQGAVVTSARFVPGDARVVTTGRGGTTVSSAQSGLALASIPGGAEDAVVTSDGDIVIARGDKDALEVHECEVCTADADELLRLARDRITREPNADEVALYGL